VIEVGSNCSGSAVGIPENMSANLIVNHGWHGAIFELDPVECERMRYFFAREHSTRHFHWQREEGGTYLSPHIVQQAITPENIEALVGAHVPYTEPDLMVIDIDAGDYAVVEKLSAVRPRVLVVEFERRFRDRHAVVQGDRQDLNRHWQQSGTASLPAWDKLLGGRNYSLCAIGAAGFNAFFVRNDAGAGKLSPLTVATAFDRHPVFASVDDAFWLSPDETWRAA
jgi:hypothetical protein